MNASGWRTQGDFYDAIFSALGAPEWRGRNLDALGDSIFGGNINAVDQPYAINIVGQIREPLHPLIESFTALVTQAAEEEGVAVSVTFADR